jgi:dipeptidyl aminopeptidase/acylaminoacyl peptidase
MPREWPGAGAPDWSPDGSRLLFQTFCRRDCGQRATGAQLFTIDPNGGRLRQLTHLRGNSYDAGWSPDGKKIVFALNRAVSPEGDISTINADGTNLRRLTHAPEPDAHMPDWGPALGRHQRARDRARPTTTLQAGVLAPVSGTTPGEAIAPVPRTPPRPKATKAFRRPAERQPSGRAPVRSPTSLPNRGASGTRGTRIRQRPHRTNCVPRPRPDPAFAAIPGARSSTPHILAPDDQQQRTLAMLLVDARGSSAS